MAYKTTKTSSLTGKALDWAVAQAAELEPMLSPLYSYNVKVGVHVVLREDLIARKYVTYSPSTDWAQGGPIIDRERITISQGRDLMASIWHLDSQLKSDWYRFKSGGPTPLVAAMRCYVLSKLGEYVDVPEEL